MLHTYIFSRERGAASRHHLLSQRRYRRRQVTVHYSHILRDQGQVATVGEESGEHARTGPSLEQFLPPSPTLIHLRPSSYTAGFQRISELSKNNTLGIDKQTSVLALSHRSVVRTKFLNLIQNKSRKLAPCRYYYTWTTSTTKFMDFRCCPAISRVLRPWRGAAQAKTGLFKSQSAQRAR